MALPFLKVGATIRQESTGNLSTVQQVFVTSTSQHGEGRVYDCGDGTPFAHLWLQTETAMGRFSVVSEGLVEA